MIKTILIVIAIVLVIGVAAVILMQSSASWTTGEVIRTPDSRFENLPDYPFEPNYVEVNGYRLHYLDEGPKDGEVVLLMHGQPSWSYLYRHMIPLLTSKGYRVIAPDNVGFGKSDKPVDLASHSYQMHVDIMSNFTDAIDLQAATLFAQDWGGLIGLRVVEQRPDRFARIMLSNTTLPAMKGIKAWLGYPLFKAAVWKEGDIQTLDMGDDSFTFTKWVAYAKTTNNFDFAALFQRATSRELSDEELAGYAAPYPSNDYIAGVRMFPTLVASQLRENQAVLDNFYKNWDKPLITAFGDSDPIMAGQDKAWQNLPGAQGQAHTTIADGAHFIQEDKPAELVTVLDTFIQTNPR